jgi:hypothetical protein
MQNIGKNLLASKEKENNTDPVFAESVLLLSKLNRDAYFFNARQDTSDDGLFAEYL